MSNPYLLAVALSISALTAACEKTDLHKADIVARFLGESPDVGIAADAGEDEPIVPEPVVAAAPVSEECISIFRVQTCEDGVLHHLNEDYSWRD